MTDVSTLGVGLARVAAALGGTTLPLSGGEERRRALHTAITGYLLPKVTNPEAPMIAVVVGPSGSGKSTLVNALAGTEVSATGPLRPTTTFPAVWAAGGLPANLVEVWPAVAERVATGSLRPPDGLVVVDSPPPDHVEEKGAEVGELMLEIADIAVFVASEHRYADASAWRLLEIVSRRRMPAVLVLNRLTGDAPTQRRLREDMARHLVRDGLLRRLGPEGVLGIEEAPRPATVQVSMLRKELDNLADPQARHMTITHGIETSIAAVQSGLTRLRLDVALERRRRRHLDRLTIDAYESQTAAFRSSLARGELAPLARDPRRVIVDTASIVARRATIAARRAARSWGTDGVAASLVDEDPTLWTHDPDTPRLAREAMRDWLEDLPRLAVRPSGRRMRRRWRRRITRAAMEGALDPSAIHTGRIGRRIARIPGLVESARRGLAEAMSEVFGADRSRFGAILGPELPASVEERLWLEVGDPR